MRTYWWLLAASGLVLALPSVAADDDDDDDDDDVGRHHGDRHAEGRAIRCDIEVRQRNNHTDIEVNFRARGLDQTEARQALDACVSQADSVVSTLGVAAGAAAAVAVPLLASRFH